MAKEQTGSARLTSDLFTQKLAIGRPSKPDAMTNAERQRKFRQSRVQVESGTRIHQTIQALADQFDMSFAEVSRELLRFALCNKNWKQTGFPSRS